MVKTSQEILLVFRDETGQIQAIADQNGSTHFFFARKMNKDAVAELLGAEPIVK